MENVAVVGDPDVSRASHVRRRITNLVKAASANDFDLAELFHETKKNQYPAMWGFESFSSYGKHLSKDYNFKWTKIYYLTRIAENMEAAKLERSQYEPVGKTKLRMISRLKPENEFNGISVSILIRELTLKAGQMTPEEVQYEVDKILGLTEDESMSWLNIRVKKMAKDNVIMPALALAKKHVGSVGVDEEGQSQDASDGRCLELICANFLADPNYNVESVQAKDVTVAQMLEADADDADAASVEAGEGMIDEDQPTNDE